MRGAVDSDNFKARLGLWMRQLIQAVVASQESAVTELPKHLQGGQDAACAAVPPLPLGPKERAYYHADGGAELGDAYELGMAADADARELYFYVPDHDDGASTEATRADLPYRNSADDTDPKEIISRHNNNMETIKQRTSRRGLLRILLVIDRSELWRYNGQNILPFRFL